MASLSGRPADIVQAMFTGNKAHLRNAAQRAEERKREKVMMHQQALLAWVKDKANWEEECRSRDAAAHLDTHPIDD